MKTITTEILIVGAGAAGLAAARDLSKAGHSVVVLEARDRIGGRIWTLHESRSELPLELGAEFMHGRSSELFSLVEAANLKVEEVTSRNWYYEKGKLVKSGEFWDAVERIMERSKEEVRDTSFKRFLDSLPDDEFSTMAKEVALRYVEGFHAADANKIGIHGLVANNEASEQIDGDRTFRLTNGYGSIAERLMREAESHNVRFELNTLVCEVRWQEQRVKVRTTDGKDWSARKLLLTIPLSVFKLDPPNEGAIEFIPPLPDAKLESVRGLEMGSALRIVLHFSQRFWKDMQLPESDQGLRQLGFLHFPEIPLSTWWTTLPKPEPMLVGWAGGPDATKLLKFDDGEIKDIAIQSLATIFGVNESVIRKYLVQTYHHNWSTDPLARGAYTYLPIGGIDYQLSLAKPVANTLFFAGEATSLGLVGTVHGAIQSGQRAAREILATDL